MNTGLILPPTAEHHSATELRLSLLISSCLILIILAVYWQVTRNEFVILDDMLYVSDNRHVQSGLAPESIKWAFSFSDKDKTYWHPLTWLSHMLDVQLFGINAGMHHLVNLLFHTANAVLLFLVFYQLTGATWKSSFAAALFALHPLNVDSVAWVAERKNILSTFFWMLTLLSYAWYIKRPGFHRYLLTLAAFLLGLMAKPMLVTLPFVLLLLDYWPLGRIRLSMAASIIRPLIEKIPFFCFSALSIYVSVSLLRDVDNIMSSDLVPMMLRIENALVTYTAYIGKTVWPRGMAVFYPYPVSILFWKVALSCLFLIITTMLVILNSKRPYLFVGWFWFLGTLVPVIGLLQTGLWPAMADRWGYIPIIGLFVITAWGIPDLLSRLRYRRTVLCILGPAALAGLAVVTIFQVRVWKDSRTLFEHALAVTSNNSEAHCGLGIALKAEGDIDAAIVHLREALRIKPDYSDAHSNLGVALEKQGRIDEAITHYREALRIRPDYAEAHYNLGNVLIKQGRIDEAINHCQEALRIQPGFYQAHNSLGVVLERSGEFDEAAIHYREAMRIRPEDPHAYNNLGSVLIKQGHPDEAVGYLREALRIKPDFVEAHNNLGVTLEEQGRIDEAVTHYLEALRVRPDYSEAHNNLGKAFIRQNRIDEAITHCQKALQIEPDYADAHNTLGIALVHKRDIEKAIEHFRKSIRLRPDYAQAYNNLGSVLAQRGDTAEAMKCFKEALRIDPDNPSAKKNLDRLMMSQQQQHTRHDGD